MIKAIAKKSKRFIQKNWLLIAASLLFIALWSQIMYRGSFGDEQENMVAGWMIIEGFVPYKDFFFHHAPFPFFVSALLQLVRGQGFQVYRFFILTFHLGLFWLGAKLASRKLHFPWILTYLLAAVSSPFIATFQFLADSLVAFSLVTLVFLLFSAQQEQRPKFTTFFSVLVALGLVTIYSSIVYALALLIIFALSLLVYWPELKKTWPEKKLTYGKMAAWAVALFLITPLYFLFNKAFSDFYWSVVTYNQEYYFTKRLAEDQLELKYGVLFRIIRQFAKFITKHFLIFTEALRVLSTTLAVSLKNIFLLQNSLKISSIIAISANGFWMKAGTIETALLVVFLLTVIYWLLTNWKLGLSFLLLAIVFRVRSSEIFHQAPFYLLVFLSLSLAINHLLALKNKIIKSSGLVIFIPALVYLTAVFYQSYRRYLRFDEPIMHPQIIESSREIQKLTEPDEEILVIGGLPTYYMLSSRYPATTYFYYHPWFTAADRIRDEIVKTVEERQASLILYDDLREERHFDPKLEKIVTNYYQPVETALDEFYGFTPKENQLQN